MRNDLFGKAVTSRRELLKTAASVAIAVADFGADGSRVSAAGIGAGRLAGVREIWVAPTATGGTGTKQRPFGSLTAAQDALRRSRKSDPGGAVIVNLLGGEYALPAEGLVLTAEDGGASPDAPVVWRAAPGERNPPRLCGAATLPHAAFQPITESADTDAWATLPAGTRDKILVADLASLGIRDYGDLPVLYRGETPLLELFFDGVSLPVARYPNEGWAETTQVLDEGSIPRYGDKTTRPGVFADSSIDADRLRRWAAASDAYVHGYFRHDWYDEFVRVGKIDPAAGTIATAVPVYYGIGRPDGVPKTQPVPPRRFVALNLLCELDAPGEWYLDRAKGRLYLYPPKPLNADTEIAVSVLSKPALSTDGASHLKIEGLSFRYTRGEAVRVSGGTDVTIARCRIDSIGGSGIVIDGGSAHRVTGCALTAIGREGIVLRGGNRVTLVPAGHVAEGNEISFFGRRQRTYAGAIHLEGVGNRAIGNSLHDAPHTAIFLSGNDHLMERNEVYRVCAETDDCGAFYMGRDPSERGNVLRWNYFHHVGAISGVGNTGVYFDDGASGNTVEGCVFYKCGVPGRAKMGAIFIHGGQRNQIVNCLFLDCQRAVGKNPWKDDRWMKFIIDEEPASKWKPAGIDPFSPPYTTHYPEIKDLARVDVSRSDTVDRCLAVGCDAFIAPERIGGAGFTVADNVELPAADAPGLLADGETGRLDAAAVTRVAAKCPGFQAIPVARIGIFS